MIDVEAPESGRQFEVLVVCSGNICRSPLAEQLLAARLLASGSPAQVQSAGTVAEEGFPMDEVAAELSRRYGGDPTSHRSRGLTEELVAKAGLVLTATRQHRAAVVTLLPRASRYSFTLVEFARLSTGLAGVLPQEVSSAPLLVQAVAAQRGHAVPPANPADDDIIDPYRRPAEVHEFVAEQIDSVTTSIAAALRGLRSDGAR